MEPIILSASRGRVALRLTCVALGTDLSVALAGGDEGHIGAVALSHPRPSRGDENVTRATTSVLALPGHREDDLARTLAGELASRLGVTVCVACGIHVDAVTPGELGDIQAMADDLAGTLVARLEQGKGV